MDEVEFRRVDVYWNATGEMPSREAELLVTKRRLILVRRIVPGWAALPLAPILLLGGAGWVGVGIPAALAILVALLGPRRVLVAHEVSDLAVCRMSSPAGPWRFFQRETVCLSFLQGDAWRLSATGRHERSAARVMEVLARAGVAPASR